VASSPEVGWETADQGEKGIVGSGKTAEERGRRVQSPRRASGVLLDSKKRRHVGKKGVLMADILQQLNKSYNPEHAE